MKKLENDVKNLADDSIMQKSTVESKTKEAFEKDEKLRELTVSFEELKKKMIVKEDEALTSIEDEDNESKNDENENNEMVSVASSRRSREHVENQKHERRMTC